MNVVCRSLEGSVTRDLFDAAGRRGTPAWQEQLRSETRQATERNDTA